MKRFIAIIAFLSLAVSAGAQDWPNLERYCDADRALASYAPGKVVLMGDSITDFWVRRNSPFFEKYGFICRGISGQTTSQMLLRFRHDVVETGASTVVILAGANDIAGNTGYVSLDTILGNIESMCEIARSNGIRVVLCSLLPAKQFSWKKEIKADELIPQFNVLLKQYAEEKHIPFVDYFEPLVDRDNPDNANGLAPAFANDPVHPNAAGYEVMAEQLLKVLRKSDVRKAVKDNTDGVKFMSYNVRNCKGMDKKLNLDRVASVINDYNPRLVALQEIDSVTVRYGKQDILKNLAVRTGMVPTYAKAIDFEGGGYGIGILSREKPLRHTAVPLPGREEKRVLLIAEFEDYIFCDTHLSLTKEDSKASVPLIMKAIDEFKGDSEKPVFIAGDWNAGPQSETLAAMKVYFDILNDENLNTFPSNNPDRTIDFMAVLKGSGVKVVETFVPAASMASDHRPVVCRVKLNNN